MLRTTIKHELVDVVIEACFTGGTFVIRRILLVDNAEQDGDDPCLEPIRAKFAALLDGTKRSAPRVTLYVEQKTAFERRVLAAARQIEWGQVISYAELARRAGAPGATRAAASVMRRNDFPLVVPCHRVVRSTGLLGGFMGRQSGAAVEVKRRLLEREGVKLVKTKGSYRLCQ